jgi:hypothetical protein
MYSAMRKAAAPMMGGMIWPPVEDAASTAPANSGLKPVFFIMGMVTEPVVTVLPTDEPLTMPHKALEMTATLAGPPLDQPARRFASEMKKLAMPVRSRKAPKMMNSTM